MSVTRQRLTWQDRKASAHPAYPDEGPASPAYPGADPEADAYENGNPSTWAEDPRPGPYVNSAHPAYPDEGPASPAYKAAKQAELKAAKCIKLATALLGRNASVTAVEDKAVELMDLSDRAIQAALSRLSAKEAAEKEEAEEEAAEKEEAPKKEASLAARVARLERILIRLAAEEEAEEEAPKKEEEAPKKEASDNNRNAFWGMSDEEMLEEMLAEEGMMGMSDEEMLEEMLAEEGMMGKTSEEEMLEEMLAEESMMGKTSEEEMPAEEACGEEACGEPVDFDIAMDSDIDPMGFEEEFMSGDEMEVLASIYGGKEASEKKVVSTRTASAQPKPQPKRAPTGATRLGGVTKQASDASDDLSKLWESAPDVSKHF